MNNFLFLFSNYDCREVVTVTHNVQQAEQTRDALSKAIYARIFDFLVEVSALALEQLLDALSKSIYARIFDFLVEVSALVF
jgi:myosin heavy subunit